MRVAILLVRVRHSHNALLHIRSPGCDARPPAVGSPRPHLHDDRVAQGGIQEACKTCLRWCWPSSACAFREVLSGSTMDLGIGDDLILGLDWISSHDLRLLYVNSRVSLPSWPAQLHLDHMPAGARLAPRTPSVIGHGVFRRLLRQIERVAPGTEVSALPPSRRRCRSVRRDGPACSMPITTTPHRFFDGVEVLWRPFTWLTRNCASRALTSLCSRR